MTHICRADEGAAGGEGAAGRGGGQAILGCCETFTESKPYILIEHLQEEEARLSAEAGSTPGHLEMRVHSFLPGCLR